MDAGFNYSFPALRGKQGYEEYYVVMCPLQLIPKIFLFDEEEIPPEHRAQRVVNKNRVPEITNYMVNNTDYVFSSLTASIDGDTIFEPFSEQEGFQDLGKLIVSLDATFLINDGQHRRAAIEEALKISPELGKQTISVVFYLDKGLTRSQQIFSDLNRHAINTTSSLGILYEHRNPLALLTKSVIADNDLLVRYTDKERVSLAKHSPKLFALNHVHNTNIKLLSSKEPEVITKKEEQFVRSFWQKLCVSIEEWEAVKNKKLTPSQLRAEYIVGHGVFLEAIGVVGHYLYKHHYDKWETYISKLSSIDWNRSNKVDWEGRAFGPTGRINKNNQTIQLTANRIKQKLGLSLTDQEHKLELKLEGEVTPE